MKQRARRCAALAVAVALAAPVVACSPTAGPRETVTLALSTLHNPFFRQLRAGAREAAELAGVRLVVVGAGNSADRQARQLSNAVGDDAEAVVLNPVDSEAAAAAVEPVLRADIPVVAVDRQIEGADVASTVVSDNFDGGLQAAEALASSVEGPAQVIHLRGMPDTSSSVSRGRGFDQGIAQHEEIDVVAERPAYFDRETARTVTAGLLKAHPTVKGIFAENDEMALGAVDALGGRAGTEVKVVGYDGIPAALELIEEGTMEATVAQVPHQLGRAAVEQAVSTIDGAPVAPHVPVGVELVTAENVGQYR